MIPTVPAGGLRVVLSWGERPYDADLWVVRYVCKHVCMYVCDFVCLHVFCALMWGEAL